MSKILLISFLVLKLVLIKFLRVIVAIVVVLLVVNYTIITVIPFAGRRLSSGRHEIILIVCHTKATSILVHVHARILIFFIFFSVYFSGWVPWNVRLICAAIYITFIHSKINPVWNKFVAVNFSGLLCVKIVHVFETVKVFWVSNVLFVREVTQNNNNHNY